MGKWKLQPLQYDCVGEHIKSIKKKYLIIPKITLTRNPNPKSERTVSP